MQKQMQGLQMQQLEKQVNTPDTLGTEQLLAKAIQLGGVQNLSPQEQAQLQAADISQRAKQSVDARGNVITNQSYFDLMGSPSQINKMPPAEVMGAPMGQRADSGSISPQTYNAPFKGGFQDVGAGVDDPSMMGDYLPDNQLPQDMVDPTMVNALPLPPEPDYSNLSPYTAEDARKAYLEDVRKVQMENAKLAREAAQAQQSKQKEMPKAELAFNSMRDDTENMMNTIDKAIDMTGGFTAGWGTMLSGVPASGAKNLESTLSTIQADSAFSTLQAMRDASPTGGALGAISERELALLQNARVALDQSQSPEKLKENLENYKRIRSQALKNTAEGFKLDYGYYPKGLEEFVQRQSQPKETGQISWEEYFK
jgi:hypothetical protein